MHPVRAALAMCLFTASLASAQSTRLVAGVTARADAGSITLNNGLIEVVVSRKTGSVSSFKVLGDDAPPRELGSGEVTLYWDANAELLAPPADGSTPPKKGYFRSTPASADDVRLAVDSKDRAEVMFAPGRRRTSASMPSITSPCCATRRACTPMSSSRTTRPNPRRGSSRRDSSSAP
jgi:hypothetical protein